MQYLHLVYLAEQQRKVLTGRDDAAMRGRLLALDTLPDVGRRTSAMADDGSLFFTDGPYIETKEYLAGS
jgi:hypothetical protein